MCCLGYLKFGFDKFLMRNCKHAIDCRHANIFRTTEKAVAGSDIASAIWQPTAPQPPPYVLLDRAMPPIVLSWYPSLVRPSPCAPSNRA